MLQQHHRPGAPQQPPPPPPNKGSSTPPTSSTSKQKEPQLNRACESCRILKVRCHVDESSPTAPCLRCAKTGRACVFAPPQRRKPRRRTDARVAELEKEVRAMRLMLADSRAAVAAATGASSSKATAAAAAAVAAAEAEAESLPSRGSSTPSDGGASSGVIGAATSRTGVGGGGSGGMLFSDKADDAHVKFQMSSGPPPLPPQYETSKPITHPHPRRPTSDVVDRGVIPLEMAEQLFEKFETKLNHMFPGISLPKHSTGPGLRESKPALWLAVLAAASISTDPHLAGRMNEEVIRMLAERVFVSGEKSVELIQALHLTVIYYYPPPTTNRLLFYQYSNLAAGLIIELGLVSKPPSLHHPTSPKEETLLDRVIPEDILERSRVMLSCYAYTSGLAMRLRRPAMLPYNNWMGECIEYLARSPDLVDKRVAAWAKMFRITEETALIFGLDDASTEIEMNEARLQAVLKRYEKRMEEWLRNVDPSIPTLSILLDYYANIITIWEFAIDGGRHDAGEFKHKYFSLPSLDSDAPLASDADWSAFQIDAISKAVNAIQSLLDEVLKLSPMEMRECPNIIFVRSMYAIILLLTVLLQANVSSLGDYIEPESLKSDYYMQRYEELLVGAAGPEGFRSGSHWLRIFRGRAKPWHEKLKLRVSAGNTPSSNPELAARDSQQQQAKNANEAAQYRASQQAAQDRQRQSSSQEQAVKIAGSQEASPHYDYTSEYVPPVTKPVWTYTMDGTGVGVGVGLTAPPAGGSPQGYYQPPGGMPVVTMPTTEFDFPMDGSDAEFLGFNSGAGVFVDWAQQFGYGAANNQHHQQH